MRVAGDLGSVHSDLRVRRGAPFCCTTHLKGAKLLMLRDLKARFRATFERLRHQIDVGFNNPVGRARTGAVDLLEPTECFQHPRSEQSEPVRAGHLCRD